MKISQGGGEMGKHRQMVQRSICWDVGSATASHSIKTISPLPLALLLVRPCSNSQEAISHFAKPVLTVKHSQFS